MCADISLSRVKKEVEKMIQFPPLGISCYPKDDSLRVLDASIIGVKGSPYESGIFKLEVDITDKYPFYPPRVRFITKIYHPNIDESGRICLDLLKPAPKGAWRPGITIEGLLIAIQCLLGQPNPDDPLMKEIASEYLFNQEEFKLKAKEWTKRYAFQGISGNVFFKEEKQNNNFPTDKRKFDATCLETPEHIMHQAKRPSREFEMDLDVL